jgi:hypothetical protein
MQGRLDDMGESGVIVPRVTDQSLPSAPKLRIGRIGG